MHKVEEKQTLYSIAKKYHVEVTEIVLANPEAEKVIVPGQLLRIPIEKVKPSKPSVINPDSIDYKKFIAHQVVKGQTLFSIAKQYDISLDEITAANPQISSDGLKYGEIIVIPRKYLKNKKLTNSEPEKKIDEPTVEIQKDAKEEKHLSSSYKIAVMLPFYLSKNDSIENHTSDYDDETIYQSSEVAAKFYEGLLLAVDSLRKGGLSIQLYVYDTANDSSLVQQIIHKPEFKELDLIIGPFFPSHIVMVADSAKKYNIPVISPFSNSELILSRENIIKSTPSKNAELSYLAGYIDTAYYKQNIIILHNNRADEKKLIEEYKHNLKDTSNILVVNYSSAKNGIDYLLNDEKKNAILVFSTQEDFVTNVIAKLNSRRNSYNIHLFSLSSWEKLKSIEVQYLQNLNYAYTCPFYVDYDNDKTEAFIASFKNHYKTEPDKYAFVGFDLSYYMLGLLKSNGKKFMNQIEDTPFQSLHTHYLFSRTSKTSALENSYYSIIKFDKFHLLKVN